MCVLRPSLQHLSPAPREKLSSRFLKCSFVEGRLNVIDTCRVWRKESSCQWVELKELPVLICSKAGRCVALSVQMKNRESQQLILTLPLAYSVILEPMILRPGQPPEPPSSLHKGSSQGQPPLTSLSMFRRWFLWKAIIGSNNMNSSVNVSINLLVATLEKVFMKTHEK